MDGGRSFRGWLGAITVAIMLTLAFLVVEKHSRLTVSNDFQAPSNAAMRGATTENRGILLTQDPGLAGVSDFPATDRTPIARKSDSHRAGVAASRLRRPPEPAANVVLQAPVAIEELTELPLYSSSTKVDYLMEAMDRALKSPLQAVSVRRVPAVQTSVPAGTDRLALLPAPDALAGRLPEPRTLYAVLESLQQVVERPASVGNNNSRWFGTVPISRLPAANVSAAEAQQLHALAQEAYLVLERVVMQYGLEHPTSQSELRELARLAAQVSELGDSLTDHDLARQAISAAHALQRRVDVWQAIYDCLHAASLTSNKIRNPDSARQELAAAIKNVETKLSATGDVQAWRAYLLLDDLNAWVNASHDIWSEGNSLALRTLSRLNWQRLNEAQKRFLAQPEFEELAAHLSVWGRDPVDYHQLLSELEALEEDPISRVAGSLANSVQILRLSNEPAQQVIAGAVNDNYRNANIRLCLSRELIERLLPDDTYEVRPVRQRILGADTSGDSAVRTELRLKLIPDASGWNVGVGVAGQMISNTRSSKGPAVFHNTSTAQINCHRFVRLDPRGYRVSTAPTDVDSRDYLQKMSTDFDSLPIIGDLARFLVREQFDQKRGLAQRIARRIIAQQADAEIDRRLEESLTKAESELERRLVGPLERLNLNPIVVAMNTTEERLSIRYRLANATQMAAQSPRPRAPSDSLLSMQLHQSAINNAIAQLGLSGRRWRLAELYQRLGEVFQQSNWEVPDDVPADLSIRFADSRPATIELADGKLRLTLRIAELHHPEHFHIERFIVSSTYIPIADGLTAGLVRDEDGVVEIMSHPHDRLTLRVIFAKVFVSNPRIPLISQSWLTDPRSAGLAVSQVEIRDGWMAVAISNDNSPLAAEVAARAQQLQLLK